jgi:hypothetical protein
LKKRELRYWNLFGDWRYEMREIKFKAKILGWDKWVYGYYLLTNEKSTHQIFCPDSEEYYLIDPKTVCQYTGLKDSTKWEDLTEEERKEWTRHSMPSEWGGVEIYEGDIIKINHPQDMTGDFTNKRGLVFWWEEEAAFYHGHCSIKRGSGRPPKRMWKYVGRKKEKKVRGDMDMRDIQSVLGDLLFHYSAKRGTGHTYTMLHGVKYNPDAIIIVNDTKHAETIQSDCEDKKLKFVTLSQLQKLLGQHYPIILDNFTIFHILNQCSNEITRVRNKLKEKNRVIKEIVRKLEIESYKGDSNE